MFTKLSPEEATAVATEGERFEIVEYKLVALDLLHLPVPHGVPALRLPISLAEAIFRRIRHRFSTLAGVRPRCYDRCSASAVARNNFVGGTKARGAVQCSGSDPVMKNIALRNHGYGAEMSHLYDTIEPNVVSVALLRDCVDAQRPKGEAGKIAKEQGTDFAEVTRLRLDFQSMRAHAAERGFQDRRRTL